MPECTNDPLISFVTNEHVLVTGGAGYIGSSLVPQLLQHGYMVTVFDQFYYGISSLLSVIADPNLRIIKGNICNTNELRTVLTDEITTVIHLAAIVGYPACDENPELAIEVNETGTANIVELIRPNQKLIFASTGSCYGAIKGLCTEETPISPLTLYGKTKSKSEEMILSKGGVCLRLATLFGVSQRMRLDLLINNITQILLNEREIDLYEADFRRTFLHVRDAAHAFCFTISHYAKMKEQIFNVGDESMNMTKKMAAQKIIEQMPFPCSIRVSVTGQDKDKRDYEVSYEKIKRLGFRSTISIEKGVEELLKTLPQMSLSEIKLSKNIS